MEVVTLENSTIKPIKKLSSHVINLIAAGEVIDRPYSVVKELVENSLDAGATEISIEIECGGKNLISIQDNGHGMNEENLILAIERHATSKLNESDIYNISTFGFRGEALPSIASVSRLNIISKTSEMEIGNKLNIEGGEFLSISPRPYSNGTFIEVRDLFFAVPARLKFLKTDKAEQQLIIEAIEKIAIANPKVKFNLIADRKQILNLEATNLKQRIADVVGKDFIENSIEINFENENLKVSGFISLPTFNKRLSSCQYFYINNRNFKDKNLINAVKIAYQDVLASNRYAVVVLFIETPYYEVDVNVHPAKTEIRFRDIDKLRKTIISGIKKQLEVSSNKTSSHLADHLINMVSKASYSPAENFRPEIKTNFFTSKTFNSQINLEEKKENEFLNFPFKQNPVKQSDFQVKPSFTIPISEPSTHKQVSFIQFDIEYPLGLAKCQINSTYLISETKNGMILVDIHAAHERILYEKFKAQLILNGIKSQKLLLPILVSLTPKQYELLKQNAEIISKLGLILNFLNQNEVEVHGVPIELSGTDYIKLLKDICDDLEELGEITSLEKAFESFYETLACHTSIRAGKILSIPEMNQLLREMEKTNMSGQCNHGRPTYIEIKVDTIEKIRKIHL